MASPLRPSPALDTSSSAGRSWVATGAADPPDPPLLPPDQSLFCIDELVGGNWMIRGVGTAREPLPSAVESPTLGRTGAALLFAGLLLALAMRRASASRGAEAR